jgi:hypothetical protein
LFLRLGKSHAAGVSERTRPVERIRSRQVEHRVGLDRLQQLGDAARSELEDALGEPLAKALHDLLVDHARVAQRRERVEVDLLARALLDQLAGVVMDLKTLDAQRVELDEAVVADDGEVGGVRPARHEVAALAALERHELRDRLGRDDDACGVLACVSDLRRVVQAQRMLEDLRAERVVLAELL